MGVSPRGTLLRGQGIIEYVLIIAVIGLVIVFAGPGVTTSNYSGASSSDDHWTRSVDPNFSTGFRNVYSDGDWIYDGATLTLYVFPAFSF